MTNEHLDALMERLRNPAYNYFGDAPEKAADAITALRARAEAAEADAERLAEALYKEADRLFDEGYVLLPESVQALAAHNERKQDADEK